MEDHRDKGSHNLKVLKSIKNKDKFFLVFLVGVILSALFLCLSQIVPFFTSHNYYERGLNQLRNKAQSIKSEFAEIIEDLGEIYAMIQDNDFPERKDEIFSLLKSLPIDQEKVGVAFYDSDNMLALWLGQVIDLSKITLNNGTRFSLEDKKSTFLVQNKASAYLVSIKRLEKNQHIVFYRLLAFLPQFKTPYLKEYHFLDEKLLENCSITYQDFRENVSGFERIFSRYKDEYIGQPRLQAQIQTLIFPLRNESNEIIAYVDLRSPSLRSKISSQKEDLLLIFYLLVVAALVCLLISVVRLQSFRNERNPLALLLILCILCVLRLLFFPLSALGKIQSLSVFSPSTTSFISIWNLTRSPADIFLTALCLFILISCLAFLIQKHVEKKEKRASLPVFFLFSLISIVIVLCFVFILQEVLFRLVFHSNLNLLHFSFDTSFMLIHFSIILFFFSTLLTSLVGLRLSILHAPKVVYPLVLLIAGFGVYLSFFRGKYPITLFLIQALILALVFLIAYLPWILQKKRLWLSAIVLTTLFIYASLHFASSEKEQTLLQNSLQNIIKSQVTWGAFLITQSFPEIDKNEGSIIASLNSEEFSDLAHLIWQNTLLAKFNWYSSLEILNSEGVLQSRFTLNVPEVFRINFNPPKSPEWSIFKQRVHYMGTNKNFLIAYKDYLQEEETIGRVMIYLSTDYDMLPFLYSANPYFELLRVSSIPSLNQMDLGFAIFNLDGELIFNPNKISSGLPRDLIANISRSDTSIWSAFTEKDRKYKSLYFKNEDEDRIYALFLPRKNFLKYSAEFLKLFFVYFAVCLLFILLARLLFPRQETQNPFWSFSNRVYVTIIAIALIPLFLFTFSSHYFFARIFSQKVTEAAEVQADFAKRFMQDYIYFQQEERYSLTTPPDQVVFWIGSTISNDVNLYQDGQLISSSRREFFDYGLLPDIINGEIFYKIQFENNPFYTDIQKIGNYSFHTLTIPYAFQDSLILISLPFPLEQQEISEATVELIEFLLFGSVFFIIFALLLARGIGGMIVNPIQRLLKGTKEVSLGNLETHIDYRHQDEMKTLIDGFNAMVTNLKQHQQELADMSKKVAWAEMARKVAHEIKNPLTPIQLSVEHLLKVYEDNKENFDEVLKESASYIITEVENLRNIAHEFLQTSKEASLKKEKLDLKELIQETVAPYKNLLTERIEFKETYQEQDFPLVGDRGKVKIVLRNILNNAIESIQDKGKISITLKKEGSTFLLEITDTGTGIDEEMAERIFEPYFSTKDVGTGLGLPIAKKIIEDHEGTIHATVRKVGGITISIKLPQSAEHLAQNS
ncbi:MAG: ATP-binding protein [Candidatus Aminicenantaceae bacterium]